MGVVLKDTATERVVHTEERVVHTEERVLAVLQ